MHRMAFYSNNHLRDAMTNCTCKKNGYCSTHEREMGEMRFSQCKNEPGYYEAFQKSKPKPRGLGDMVASVLEKTGVAAIVKKVKGGKDCGGCGKRQEKLNQLVPFEKKAE